MEQEIATRPRYYHPLQKDYATFLLSSEETGGEYTLVEIEVAPGGGNAPHYHNTYDEHFEVVEGTLEVMVNGTTYTLRPGEKATAPMNALHCFRNPTGETTRFRVTIDPGSPGFEKAIKVAYGLATDGLTFRDGTPRNPYHLALLIDWSESRIRGFLGTLGPIFRVLAKRAKRKGIDRELEQRYCG